MYKLCVAFATLLAVAVAKPNIGYELPLAYSGAYSLPYYSGFPYPSYPYYAKTVAPVANNYVEPVAPVATPIAPLPSYGTASLSGPIAPVYAKALPSYPYGYPSAYPYPSYATYSYQPTAYSYPYGYGNSFLLKKK